MPERVPAVQETAIPAVQETAIPAVHNIAMPEERVPGARSKLKVIYFYSYMSHSIKDAYIL